MYDHALCELTLFPGKHFFMSPYDITIWHKADKKS